MRLISLAALILLLACQKEVESEVTATTETSATTTVAAQPVEITQGFSTPESVLYDAVQDVYFVSNINGDPFGADDNGFISRVNAESLQVESKWIDGSKPDITLNAPKGMAIVGDELWVSDITSVRKFNRSTGAPAGALAIRGATFLNDLASDGSTAYVSDSGLKSEGGQFVGSGTDGVWQITGTQSKRLASGSDLSRPNGLAVVGGSVWVASFGANELYQIQNGKKANVTTLPQGGLDGLVALSDGTVLVSSWDGKAVYRGSPGGTFIAVVENVDTPADLGYDTRRRRLLLPHFNGNKVTIHEIR